MHDHPLTAFISLQLTQPDQSALIHGSQNTSFSQLYGMAQGYAVWLKEKGVTPGDVVLLRLGNRVEALALVLALWLNRATPALQSPASSTEQQKKCAEVLDDCLVIDADNLDTVGPISTGSEISRLGPHAEIASVIFTSGSAGAPKGIMQYGTTLVDGAHRLASYQLYQDKEHILCPVPWSHDYGWGQVLSCLVLGHTLILPETEDIAAICRTIETHKPTIFAGVPALYSAFSFGISNIAQTDTSSLKRLTSTGSRFSDELRTAIGALFPDIPIYLNYGLTETFRTTCLLPEEQDLKPGSIGRPIPQVSVRIVDDDGNVLPVGETGELVHIGAGKFAGYYNAPDLSDSALRTCRDNAGNLRTGVATGDLGHVDEDGYLYLTGRRDRQIKSMDIGVQLDMVEHDLMKSGLLHAVAVVAVTHPIIGQKIVATCVAKSEANLRCIRQFAKKNMSKYMQPRGWALVDALPITASKKIDYQLLLSDWESQESAGR